MNDANAKTKQQIVEKITSSSNILVTVSNDPSVDALSAALGLTAVLNKLTKHTTAIFSGAIPPAITFLDPEKTFENTPDSLRDFIIALNKEKADHLRYKIEGDVVKIFITPYKTTITSEDLEFSQGDYNVDLVFALGVSNQGSLDAALAAHGRIMHDATVVTMSVGSDTSQLGSIDWHEEAASGLSEMVVLLGQSLKSETPLLDKQIATALLTGIVAATDRFSNSLTSSQVMTMAAQLMAAGADQQLIASKLQASHEISEQPAAANASTVQDSTTSSGSDLAINHDEPAATANTAAPDVSLQSNSAPASTLPPTEASTLPPQSQPQTQQDPVSAPTPEPTPGPTPVEPQLAQQPAQQPSPSESTLPPQESTDSTLPPNDSENPAILKHSYLGSQPERTAPINGAGQNDKPPTVDVFSQPPTAGSNSTLPPAPTPPSMPPPPDVSGLPLPPPPPPVPDLVPPPPTNPPDRLGDIFSAPQDTPQAVPPPAPEAGDQSQFKIPGMPQ